MRNDLVRSAVFALAFIAGAAGVASAQTCIRIDEQHDTLQPDERTAARLLVGKQFELAGHRVVDDNCDVTYTVSHIRLGSTITVTLSGPAGTREATALGLDDLPAVYSQMVRSLTTGQPMGPGRRRSDERHRFPGSACRAASTPRATGTRGWDMAASSASQHRWRGVRLRISGWIRPARRSTSRFSTVK